MSSRIRKNSLAVLIISLGLSGCVPVFQYDNDMFTTNNTEIVNAEVNVHKINQQPVEPVIQRVGRDVHIELTAQVTDVEIAKGVFYNAWTFNGTAPGPVLRVKEGDTIHFTLRNMDPNMPHSMDFHAVHAAPSKKFIDVMPNETGTFIYEAKSPGVFMYHCGTAPVLMHIANGMYGTIIVEPRDGYPTDNEIDREYVITQNEWYKENDLQDFEDGSPRYVVFNGNTFSLKEQPLLAKVGDTVRLYVNNLGPNHISSFHVVGTLFERVYLDGNPRNPLYGMQTVLLPASGGAVVEFQVLEEGDYPFVTHQFSDASKGAVGIIRVTRDGLDNVGAPSTMSH
ncbi:nitrite reductase (NO-forming) [Paenibacillus phyllosphaerae]|uniref:Copper-containing nitrite reductase n=1 Tax=Paenibacillus phyllosphaerae TaxID=274593 RepID=A0A7W5FNM5_9BACL|nr:multicopper oxidase domain-containing protein [Paenibacillus phyllosphaerae]MBB3111164.1 nitrite reductase (NO-forming) [Paenibacillus phyllosphaerae]